jgi:xanthine/CO dehydrogenase XdhC/CoxF family maturation factor
MKEREQILQLWRELREQGSSAVLVTVVKTLGSSYRRPGARMLLTQQGRRAGSISGGCLEDDVVKRSWWMTENGPVIRRYDTTPDGDIGASGERSGGFGLGCNGIIYLLMERVSGRDGEESPLAVLERVHVSREPALMACVLTPANDAGKRFVKEAGSWSTCGSAMDQELAIRVQAGAQGVTNSVVEQLTSGEEVFFEMLTAPIRLLIFGAGDDAVPLTELGRLLGWHISVFDGRAHYARRGKFPSAHEVAVRDSSETLSDLRIDSRTVAVIMTHSYSQDLHFVAALTKECPAYVGILGPRNRSMQLLSDAGIEGADLPFLHGPVGLDIGADGPEQVALSIIAEIQATMNGREGGPLRAQTGSIHSRASDGRGAERFVPSIICA